MSLLKVLEKLTQNILSISKNFNLYINSCYILDFSDPDADYSEEEDNITFKTPTFKEDDYTEFLTKDFLVKLSKIRENKHED